MPSNVFWSCVKLQAFWKKVTHILEEFLILQAPQSLLHYALGSDTRWHHSKEGKLSVKMLMQLIKKKKMPRQHKELVEMWSSKFGIVTGHCRGNIIHGMTNSLFIMAKAGTLGSTLWIILTLCCSGLCFCKYIWKEIIKSSEKIGTVDISIPVSPCDCNSVQNEKISENMHVALTWEKYFSSSSPRDIFGTIMIHMEHGNVGP